MNGINFNNELSEVRTFLYKKSAKIRVNKKVNYFIYSFIYLAFIIHWSQKFYTRLYKQLGNFESPQIFT